MKNRVRLSVTAAAVLMAAPSVAQEQQGAVHMLNEVVVTATKTEREVKEIPTNVAVLTAKDIERIQPTDTMDLLRHVPGLVLNGMGSGFVGYGSFERKEASVNVSGLLESGFIYGLNERQQHPQAEDLLPRQRLGD